MVRLILILWLMSLASVGVGQTRVPTSQTEITLGFVPLVKQAAPAVVNPGRHGQKAGLKTGDVILAVNNQVVTISADVRAFLTSTTRRVSMDIERGGRRVQLRFWL